MRALAPPSGDYAPHSSTNAGGPRYPTPLADAAREMTRHFMRTHMRSATVELAVSSVLFFAIAFSAACTI